jgi:long-chain acyl-CoA synthetase
VSAGSDDDHGMHEHERDRLEIEEVLDERAAVLQAAVVGQPDEALGEEFGAAVVLRPGVDTGPDGVREFVKERVAAYRYPRRGWFTGALPKGASANILKRELPVPDSPTS